jgi:hypothetical protein
MENSTFMENLEKIMNACIARVNTKLGASLQLASGPEGVYWSNGELE